MFGFTDRFLKKSHEAFEELGYYTKTGVINDEEFLQKAIYTVNHTDQLIDAINATRMVQFIFWNKEKIAKAVSKNWAQWNSMKYVGNELLSLVNDEDAIGKYYITNAYSKNGKTIYISGATFGEDLYFLDEKHGKYFIGENNGTYYIRKSMFTSSEIVLLNNKDEKLAVIALTNDCQILLKNNKTPFEIVLYEGFMGIYSKNYIESLHGGEPDINNLLAAIEWDILVKNSKYAVAKLSNFREESDLNMFILFAAAAMLSYNNYIKESNLISINAAIIAGTTWSRR